MWIKCDAEKIRRYIVKVFACWFRRRKGPHALRSPAGEPYLSGSGLTRDLILLGVCKGAKPFGNLKGDRCLKGPYTSGSLKRECGFVQNKEETSHYRSPNRYLILLGASRDPNDLKTLKGADA